MKAINLVFNEDQNQRLDVFLSFKTGFTRNQIKKIIESNNVLVNEKKIIKAGFVLKKNDLIKILENDFLAESLNKIIPWENEKVINIIFENEDFIILNKPSNLVVHPSNNYDYKTLVNALVWKFKILDYNLENRPGIVHRLDKNTSGILIVSKNLNFTNWIQKQFKNRKIKKTYLAILDGKLNHKNGVINAPLGKSSSSNKIIIDGINSKEAITKFKVLKTYNNNTLVEFSPSTGRTHQLRVHSKYINHSISNDVIYEGKPIKNFEDFGQFLHAYKIEFFGIDNKKYSFEAELPKEFLDFMEILKNEEVNEHRN